LVSIQHSPPVGCRDVTRVTDRDLAAIDNGPVAITLDSEYTPRLDRLLELMACSSRLFLTSESKLECLMADAPAINVIALVVNYIDSRFYLFYLVTL